MYKYTVKLLHNFVSLLVRCPWSWVVAPGGSACCAVRSGSPGGLMIFQGVGGKRAAVQVAADRGVTTLENKKDKNTQNSIDNKLVIPYTNS